MTHELRMRQQQEAYQSAEMVQAPVGREVLYNVENARAFVEMIKLRLLEYPGHTIIALVLGESGVAKKGVAAGALLQLEEDEEIRAAMGDYNSDLITTYMSTGDGLDLARRLKDIPEGIPNDQLQPHHHDAASRRLLRVANWMTENAGEMFVPDRDSSSGFRRKLVTRVAMFETIGILQPPSTLDVDLDVDFPARLNIGSALLHVHGHNELCVGFGVVTNSEVWKRTYALRDKLRQGGDAAAIYREFGVELDGRFSTEQLARLSGNPEVMQRIRQAVNKNMLALGPAKLNTVHFTSVDDLELNDALRQSALDGYLKWNFAEYGMEDRSLTGKNPLITGRSMTYLEKYVEQRRPDFSQIFREIVTP